MKNPFCVNFTWLSIMVIITGVLLLPCNLITCNWSIHLSTIGEKIIIGLFYSSLLLLMNEFIQYISDKLTYGYMKGIYTRTIITDVLANNKREENLSELDKVELAMKFQEAIPGSRYKELLYYRDVGKNWKIKLTYLHNGIYEGIADYHKYWEGNYESTKVKFTLTLNKSNLGAGSGTYKYIERDDYGTYFFQVNDNDKSEILVSFMNTIPSGLAQGYEKWKKI